tara:strand:+ start:19588 stop:22137 length:2550 start_codon:yes stop_codon:yes gene_type:complete
MTIVWRTLTKETGKVWYGTAPNQLTKSVQTTQKDTQHELKITGLTPNTRYYYAVGTTSKQLQGGSSSYTFKTAPTVGSKQPFRFWVVGDSGTGLPAQSQVRDAMSKYVGNKKPDIYLHMGDMAYLDGRDYEFQLQFFNVYKSILRNTVCWPTIGNHEGHTSRSGPQTGAYYDAYVLPKAGEAGGVASGTEAYYSFDYANVHFVVLDSHDSPRTPSGAMLQWLKRDLASTKQKWLIAFWHHPPYSKGSHDSDTESQLTEMRKHALPILEAAGVDLVLAGHSHIYERSYLVHGAYNTPTTAAGHIVDKGDGKLNGDGAYNKPTPTSKGAVYIVAGHGGAPLTKKGTHPLMYITETKYGSCIVDVHDNTLKLVNVRSDGKVSDQFTLVKGSALLLQSPNGGERFLVGEQVDIKWQTVGTIANVKLEYTTDDGKTWKSIQQQLANTGRYTWTLPAVTTTQARVRITDAKQASSTDQSDAVFTIDKVVQRPYIKWGDTWKYHDSGKDLGSAWTALSYDDSSWKAGPAQLGYGEGDEKTKLKDALPNYKGAYFRKTFTLTETITKATLDVLFDDGFVVWINGKRIHSVNAKDGDAYDKWASATSKNNERITYPIPLTNHPFVQGKNIVAVLVKQRSALSSDLSFDLQLTLEVQQATPTFAPIGNKQIQEEQTLTFKVNATHPQNKPLTYSTSQLPSGATFVASTQQFTWTPQRGQSGVYKVTFTATDPSGLSGQEAIDISVTPAPPQEPTPSKDASTPDVQLKDNTPKERKTLPEATKETTQTKETPQTNEVGTPDQSAKEVTLKDIVVGHDHNPQDKVRPPADGCGCSASGPPSLIYLTLFLLLFGLRLRRPRS